MLLKKLIKLEILTFNCFFFYFWYSWLFVGDYPKPFILSGPKSGVTITGADYTLSCTARSTSSKDIKIRWKKDNYLLPSKSYSTLVKSLEGKGVQVMSDLRIMNVTSEDKGNYQCVVGNSFGKTYSSRANLTVYGKYRCPAHKLKMSLKNKDQRGNFLI